MKHKVKFYRVWNQSLKHDSVMGQVAVMDNSTVVRCDLIKG